MHRFWSALASRWTDVCALSAVLCAGVLASGCGLTGADCDSTVYYGPPPCQTDQACADQNGAGWYCDKTHVINQECGVTWPTCVKR